ncbi:hypothetical protein O181_109626 [Austropuccinia psidii MF-1]|uniref:Uncharacterized protein n=1 Tax=Austropuccinia psidii MF-1 TaxID=1389203 RepID=A0A9Q3JX38_9BASI|nr:hypothetical protein [Austropuccinia psidii MF-1]
MHPRTGHTQATFTHLEDILLPVLRPAICLVGWLVMFAWVSPTAGHFLHVLTRPVKVVAPGFQPKIPLGGWPLLPEFRVNVYVDHGSWLAPPLIIPHIPPWKPNRHQSEKNFRENQSPVWWHATKHISPAHTQTSPQ